MRVRTARVVFVVCVVVFVLAPGSLLAQKFVYVNNNILGPNSVSGFATSGSGSGFTLTPIPGSPFLTGGNGASFFYANNQLAMFSDGQFLFATDPGSSDVAVFAINQSTGGLTPVPGSPFSTGQNDISGMSIAEAVTPSGNFLYAANFDSASVSVFSIAQNGALTLTAFSPIPLGVNPLGIAIRASNKFLAVALSGSGLVNEVGVFSVGLGGTLTPVPGSPFAGTGGPPPTNLLTGVDFKCGEKFLFGAEANITGTVVDVYRVAPNGTATPIPGDPFTFGSGTVNSNVLLYSPAGQLLFVSNQSSSTITDFRVASDGSLTPVAGAPFSTGISGPSGMAVGNAGGYRLLYVTGPFPDSVAALSVSSDGTLSPVAGSPFSTGQSGFPFSVAVHPPLGCP